MTAGPCWPMFTPTVNDIEKLIAGRGRFETFGQVVDRINRLLSEPIGYI